MHVRIPHIKTKLDGGEGGKAPKPKSGFPLEKGGLHCPSTHPVSHPRATRGKGATCPQWRNRNRWTVNRQYVGEILPSPRVTPSPTKICCCVN